MIQFFCPRCFAKVLSPQSPCPVCGVESADWINSHTYPRRLIQALDHPIAEVRMAAVISLGNQGDPGACGPLARCALTHPTDLELAREVTKSLAKLPFGPERDQAIALLQTHPAKAVRDAAARIGSTRDKFSMPQ